MIATESVSNTPTYWFVFGFSEGKRQAFFLRQKLDERGFRQARDLASADIVIAHSGGCFDVSQNLKTKHVFLCQPACGYPETGLQILRYNLRSSFADHRQRGQLRRWGWKTGWNLGYAFAKYGTNRRIIRQALQYHDSLAPVGSRKVTVIISQNDPFSRRLPREELRSHPERAYIGVSGGHDDLWTKPEQLAHIITATYAA